MAISAFRFENSQQGVHQAVRFDGMVTAEVADIHVQRHRLQLGPGVDTEVRFGQQNSGGANSKLKQGDKVGVLIAAGTARILQD